MVNFYYQLLFYYYAILTGVVVYFPTLKVLKNSSRIPEEFVRNSSRILTSSSRILKISQDFLRLLILINFRQGNRQLP